MLLVVGEGKGGTKNVGDAAAAQSHTPGKSVCVGLGCFVVYVDECYGQRGEGHNHQHKTTGRSFWLSCFHVDCCKARKAKTKTAGGKKRHLPLHKQRSA